MNIEDRLPKAEDILKSKYNAFKESGLPFTSDTGLKWQLDAMHEYARRLLDVVAEENPEKKYNGLDTHCGGKNCPFEYSCTVSCIIPDKGFDLVPNQKILKLKEMLK